MDIKSAIEILRANHTVDKPATLEQMAAACGIDVNAPHSYREVLEMSESLRFHPAVVRFWVGGERFYYAVSVDIEHECQARA